MLQLMDLPEQKRQQKLFVFIPCLKMNVLFVWNNYSRHGARKVGNRKSHIICTYVNKQLIEWEGVSVFQRVCVSCN